MKTTFIFTLSIILCLLFASCLAHKRGKREACTNCNNQLHCPEYTVCYNGSINCYNSSNSICIPNPYQQNSYCIKYSLCTGLCLYLNGSNPFYSSVSPVPPPNDSGYTYQNNSFYYSPDVHCVNYTYTPNCPNVFYPQYNLNYYGQDVDQTISYSICYPVDNSQSGVPYYVAYDCFNYSVCHWRASYCNSQYQVCHNSTIPDLGKPGYCVAYPVCIKNYNACNSGSGSSNGNNYQYNYEVQYKQNQCYYSQSLYLYCADYQLCLNSNWQGNSTCSADIPPPSNANYIYDATSSQPECLSYTMCYQSDSDCQLASGTNCCANTQSS